MKRPKRPFTNEQAGQLIELLALAARDYAEATELAADDDAPDLRAFEQRYRQLPVPLAALFVYLVNATAGNTLTRSAMAKAGCYGTGKTLQTFGATLELLRETAPQLADALLRRPTRSVTVDSLAAELQQRDETIASLRGQLDQAVERIESITNYAAALHLKVRKEFEQNIRERAAKVAPLAPVPDPSPPTAG